MYQSLLTRRYLTSKVMPLLAALAVALCVMMVLVVWSVMSGFLTLLLNSGRTLMGDVIVEWPNTGFAYYQDLGSRLEKDPMVRATAPVIETFGLLGLPDGRVEMVRVCGVEGPSYARVTGYEQSLWWRPITEPVAKDTAREDWRLDPKNAAVFERLYKDGLTLSKSDPEGDVPRPAVVPGVQVSGFNIRRPQGFFVPGVPSRRTQQGGFEEVRVVLPVEGEVTLNVLPLDSRGRSFDMVGRTFPVANEFHSGLYDIDSKVVLVELGALQEMLRMDPSTRVGAQGQSLGAGVERDAEGQETGFALPQVVGDEPARVTTLYVRAADGVDAEVLKARVREIYAGFERAHEGGVPGVESIRIQSWRDKNQTMISAVENETGMMLILFGIISMVSVVLVLAIFWSMVSEKTKDVGILRALGASRSGVAWVWIRYGLGIGILGSLAGLGLAYLIVANINEIHDWLGRVTGHPIWNPSVYYFSVIPAKFQWSQAVIVFATGVLACGVGAVVPALRAARMDPVRALRFE